jgi:hypothetical protein
MRKTLFMEDTSIETSEADARPWALVVFVESVAAHV